MMFQNFILFDKPYRNRFFSNKLDRIRLWFVEKFIGREFLYLDFNARLNSYPKSGSFTFSTRYFKTRVEYIIKN